MPSAGPVGWWGGVGLGVRPCGGPLVLFARGAAGVPAGDACPGRGGGGAARAGPRGLAGAVTVRPIRRSEPAQRSEGGRPAEGTGATVLHTHPLSSRASRGFTDR